MIPEMEKEVQARVEFKMNELLTGVKNQAKVHWHSAFVLTSQKYQNYWEAFEQMEGMLKKELYMPVPYDDMYDKRMRQIKNDAAEEIVKMMESRNIRHPREREYIRGRIANLIENACKKAIQ